LNVACGRLSYTFGFNGPCLSVDTICSASLISAHVASRMLHNGECESSLSAGVNMSLLSTPFVVLVIANMLASDGRCKTLDQAGDGYVRAEACGVVEMKDFDAIGHLALVLVCGSAANQDGRSSSLTAPNGPSQQAAIRRALEVSGTRVQQYEHLEMHGTGTSLGDPIEVGAACAVVLPSRIKRGPLTLWAAKASHGHAEAGAGVLNIVHCLASMSHLQSSCLTTLRVVNPYVAETMNIAKLTFAPRELHAISSELVEEMTVTGISAFAFQGSNAHMILGDADSMATHQVSQRVNFNHQLLWVYPRAHPLVTHVHKAKAGKVVTYSHIGRAALSYLWDHSINGKTTFSFSACVEIPIAVAQVALSGGLSTAESLSFYRFSMGSPMQLPNTSTQKGRESSIDAPCIVCVTNLHKGNYNVGPLQVQSEPASNASGLISKTMVFCSHFNGSMNVVVSPSTRVIHSCLRSTVDFGVHQNLACIQLGLKRGADSGYKSHPAVADNAFRLCKEAVQEKPSSASY
jgi:hypothetical protein